MEGHQAMGGKTHAGKPAYLVAAALFLLGCALFFVGSLIATKRSSALASACSVPEGAVHASGALSPEASEQEVYFVGCGGFF